MKVAGPGPARAGLMIAACSTMTVLLAGCASTSPQAGAPVAARAPQSTAAAAGVSATATAVPPISIATDPYPSTYRAPPHEPTLLRGATVLTGTGERLDDADVLMVDGKIAGVGRGLQAPTGARVIDARGKWVTPGIIDVHSHLGVYPSPSVPAHSDGNEATAPSTANVWAEHSVWPQDPGFQTALIGGVTSLQILPGSANLIGGRSVVLKNVPAATYQGMKFPGAPQSLKAACGENPKRVYGSGGKSPATRMANIAVYRAQWIEAQEYARDWAIYDAKAAKGDKDAKPPKRDLRLDTLAAALRGEIRIQQHCYRSDDMATIVDMSKEFGFKVAAFHHASEAYKISNLLAENGICAAMWADWWGFKMESYDGIQENVAMVDAAPKGCAIVHSDSDEGIQRLNQEAAKAIAAGHRAGLEIAPEHAIQWLTSNAARAIGVDSRTGSLEAGKMADVVVWNREPFSVYALAERVYVDGTLRYERGANGPPRSDFLLGQPALTEVRP
jgi:imidazolonepropionase-like amidohydrolase